MKDLKAGSKFVLCIRNEGAEDLEPRKVYQALPDRAASQEDCLRVIDESGEDYVYPANYFTPVTLPAAIARELASAPIARLQPAGSVRRRSLRTAKRAFR